MVRTFWVLLFLIFGSQILFAEESYDRKQADIQGVPVENTTRRLNELEHSLRNLQKQIDRLAATVEDNQRDLDDVKSEQRDLKRKVGR